MSGRRRAPRRAAATPAVATIAAAAAVSSWVIVAADALRRTDWRRIGLLGHFSAALALETAVGAALAVGCVVLVAGIRAATRPLDGRHPAAARVARSFLFGAVTAIGLGDTVFWAFSGPARRAGASAAWGAGLALTALMVSTAAVTWFGQRALATICSHARAAMTTGAVFGLAGVGLLYVDLTVFVALYGRIHTALEVVARLLLVAGVALVVRERSESRRWRSARDLVAMWSLAWGLVYVAAAPVRRQVERQLRHVWRSPAYLDRSLQRSQAVMAFLERPTAWRGMAAWRLARVQRNYDLSSVALDPKWDSPDVEASPVRSRIDQLRGEDRSYSVVFFYVDTLRHDVAADPDVMPMFAGFARRAVRFRSAYATSSDTLHSLPGLIDGTFDRKADEGGLLQLVHRRGIPSALFIARSAHDYLEALMPSFRFDHEVVIDDYDPSTTQVWGYGADRPTAASIVDAALSWLRRERDRQLFAWLFHYDVHNWRELDAGNDASDGASTSDRSSLARRYRRAAGDVDRQLGRFLRGLEDIGIADRTIVVFVSDHGEALGRHGFWRHSSYLWEELVRVPLAIRVPGLHPAIVDDRVSLVDVTPTLARYLSKDVDMRGYHGVDLLGYLVPGHHPRRLPLLLTGAGHHTLLRIGLIDQRTPFKLVLPFERGVATLHDLRASDADDVDLADRMPTTTSALLSELVRSPVFPRNP